MHRQRGKCEFFQRLLKRSSTRFLCFSLSSFFLSSFNIKKWLSSSHFQFPYFGFTIDWIISRDLLKLTQNLLFFFSSFFLLRCSRTTMVQTTDFLYIYFVFILLSVLTKFAFFCLQKRNTWYGTEQKDHASETTFAHCTVSSRLSMPLSVSVSYK